MKWRPGKPGIVQFTCTPLFLPGSSIKFRIGLCVLSSLFVKKAGVDSPLNLMLMGLSQSRVGLCSVLWNGTIYGESTEWISPEKVERAISFSRGRPRRRRRKERNKNKTRIRNKGESSERIVELFRWLICCLSKRRGRGEGKNCVKFQKISEIQDLFILIFSKTFILKYVNVFWKAI